MAEFTHFVEMPAEVLFRLGENGPMSSLGTTTVRVPATMERTENGVRMTPGPIAPEIADILEKAAAEIRANHEAENPTEESNA